MKIGRIEIIQSEGCLSLKKSKSSFQIGMLVYIFISFLILFPLIYMIAKNKSLSNFSLSDIIISLILIILATIFLVYNWKRNVLKHKEIELIKKDENILLNNLIFCKLNQIESVTIIELTDGDGASSFNIEIRCGANHFPVCMDQGKKNAIAIASIIGQFLNKDISFKKGRMLIP